jgi:hypothetical protein
MLSDKDIAVVLFGLNKRQHIPLTTEAASMLKKKCTREKPREHRITQREEYFHRNL